MHFNKRTIIYYALSIFISIFFVFALAIVNDLIFLQPIQIEQLQQKIDSGEITFPSKPTGEKIVINFEEVEWPWDSILFFHISLLIYWFFLGYVSRKYSFTNSWGIILSIPIVVSLLFFGDLLAPLYLLSTYLGGRRQMYLQATY